MNPIKNISVVVCVFVISCYLLDGVSAQIWRWDPKKPQPGDVHVAIYLFNVTNPQETNAGSKPILAEVGPYVYKQDRKRVNISTSTLYSKKMVKFQELKYYEFVPELSKGSENDVINFVNIPMLTAIPGLMKVPYMGAGLVATVLKRGETIVRENLRIGDILYDGIPVQVYMEVMQALKQTPPPEMEGGRLGLFKGKNGTDDGVFEVEVRTSYLDTTGSIVSWKNQTELKFWGTSKCNKLQGRTDGSVFHPNIQTNSVLQFFVPEMCRSLSWEFDRNEQVNSVAGFRFKFPDSMLDAPEQNDDNLCYCPEFDHFDVDYSICLKKGVSDVSPCRDGAPLVSSFPHFLDADPVYASGVGGMHPQNDLHKSFAVIEPKTGTVLSSSLKFQLNIATAGLKEVKALEHFPNYLFPVMWLDHRYALSPEASEALRRDLDNPDFLKTLAEEESLPEADDPEDTADEAQNEIKEEDKPQPPDHVHEVRTADGAMLNCISLSLLLLAAWSARFLT